MTIAQECLTGIGPTCRSFETCEALPGETARAGGNTSAFALWMSSPAASLARTLVQRVRALVFEKETGVDYGMSFGVLLANYDHVLSFWRTYQQSLPGMGISLLDILPKWGMARLGALYRLLTPERRTYGSGGGAWPTPTGDDAHNVTRKSGEYRSLTRTVHLWPTPRAVDGTATLCGGSGHYQMLSRHFQGEMLKTLTARKNGLLNPTFVEQMMGYPPGWTEVTSEGGRQDRKHRKKNGKRQE